MMISMIFILALFIFALMLMADKDFEEVATLVLIFGFFLLIWKAVQ